MISSPVEVRFGGLGGQGLVTLGSVLAEAGARRGLRVAASQAYGSAARGGATCADVILSTEPIDFPMSSSRGGFWHSHRKGMTGTRRR